MYGTIAVATVAPDQQHVGEAARAVLVEAHDEWQTSDRRYLAEDSMALLTAATTNDDTLASAPLLTA